MLLRDYPWLMENRKPLAAISVKPLPIGSANFWQEIPLYAFSTFLVMLGEDIALAPSYVTESYLYQDRYWVFGSYEAGSFLFGTYVRKSATRGYVNLPFDLDMALALPSIPVEQGSLIVRNAMTVELVLGIVREFHLILGYDNSTLEPLELELRNWMNVLAINLWVGDELLWSNVTNWTGQSYYKISPPYDPMKFTIVFGEQNRPLRLAGSFAYGTAQFSPTPTEQMLLLIGLSEAPVMLTFPYRFTFGFGSAWLCGVYGQSQREGRAKYWSEREFPDNIRVNLPESWFRLWQHRILPFATQIAIPKPFEAATWIKSHTRVYNASLETTIGSLIISWSSISLPVFCKLVAGTTVYYNATPFTYSAPITHISYSAELSAEAISSSGNIELTPFRLTDWTTYAWVAYPLAQYTVELETGETLFAGARVGHSVQTERIAVHVGIELADNQALLRRMTADIPVSYDYWDSERAARDFLDKFGLKFVRHSQAPNMPLLPEFYSERRTNYAWRPRLGELALDFFNRIAQLNGWRVDWTVCGTVIAYPKWLETTGTTWIAYWPTPDEAFTLADLLVARLNVNISDYERRNILILYGIDAWTNYDVIKIFADFESFSIPWSDRFMPIAVPAFVQFAQPVPEAWMDYLGAQLSQRLFVTPFELEFVMPLFLKIRPGHAIRFQNANPLQFHRYDFVVTSVRHEIGKEYNTVVRAIAFRQRED